MSEGRLTEAELLAALNPPVQPTTGAGGWVADMLAAAGLALALALLISALLGVFAKRRARGPGASDTATGTENLPQDLARLRLFKRLKSAAPEALPEFRSGLYDPAAPFDLERAEALLKAAEARAR